MIVVMSTIRVTEGDPDALAEQYRARSQLAENHPGCLGVEILRNQENPSEFVVYTRWKDLESYDQYRSSDAYRTAHSRIAEIPGRIKIDPASRTVQVFEHLS
jgi:heme oxygenase (mycobilin-producing)